MSDPGVTVQPCKLMSQLRIAATHRFIVYLYVVSFSKLSVDVAKLPLL
ncbi:MAG: hypothetical protein CM15mV4_2920 [Caudoviricetes sp.]|nr:MAG: hypothetical protein CM15mV4_2920 [Caudoviricetes sp.]